MTTDTAELPQLIASPQPVRRQGPLRQLVVDTGYTLTAFPVAVASFVVVVTGGVSVESAVPVFSISPAATSAAVTT